MIRVQRGMEISSRLKRYFVGRGSWRGSVAEFMNWSEIKRKYIDVYNIFMKESD